MGYSINELLGILNGKLYKNLNKSTIEISDFEYMPQNLSNDYELNAFISISKKRWNEVHNKKTNWKDGNESILDHYDKCSLIITESPIEELENTITQIIVKNTYRSLIKLCQKSRSMMKNPVIAITGSVGKSTTRLMIEHSLSKMDQIKTVATRGNHNTQSGVPLYGAKLASNPDVGILEVSLNALNNRGNQSLNILPDVCIVTSIGEAHMSTLHSTEKIATFKSRIFKGLKKDGIAIISKDIDDIEYNILYEEAIKRTNKIYTYSINHKMADLFLVSRVVKKEYTEIVFSYQSKMYKYEMTLPSDGAIANSFATMLALDKLSYKISNTLPSFKDFKSLDRVMETKYLNTKDNRKITLIDDSHNAAIPSTINAIQTFKNKAPFYKGKKILVLGQVSDLGDATDSLHDKLLPFILNSGADFIFGHGKPMRRIIKKLPNKVIGGWFENSIYLSKRIPLYCTNDSLVLIKGSVSGSDFRRTSHLLPLQLKNSNRFIMEYTEQSITKSLFPIPSIQINNLKNDQTKQIKGSNGFQGIQGLGAVIFLLMIINKNIDNNKKLNLGKWNTNVGKSINGKPFKNGQSFTYDELIWEVAFTQHPSAIYELSYRLYNNRKNAYSNILEFGKNLGLSEAAILNLTGRYRVKEQQSFSMQELVLIGKHIKDTKSKYLRMNKTEFKGIIFGKNFKHGILIKENTLITFLNLESIDDLNRELKNNLTILN